MHIDHERVSMSVSSVYRELKNRTCVRVCGLLVCAFQVGAVPLLAQVGTQPHDGHGVLGRGVPPPVGLPRRPVGGQHNCRVVCRVRRVSSASGCEQRRVDNVRKPLVHRSYVAAPKMRQTGHTNTTRCREAMTIKPSRDVRYCHPAFTLASRKA